METRQIHVRDLSTVTGIQQYEHCVQSIFFLGLEDFEGTIYLSIESDKFSEDVALTNNTFIIGQPMTKFNVTYTCQIYGIVGTGEKIQLSKQFRMVVYKSNTISGEAGEYPIDPNIVNGIDQYITTKESQIDDYVEQVIESIPSDYSALSSEVSDIRTGADGTIYNSAGDAVRGQVTDLKSALDAIENTTPVNLLNNVTWEIGSINASDGSDIGGLGRIRTDGFIDLATINAIEFTIAEGYKYVVDWYNADKTANKAVPFGVWQTNNQIIAVPADVAYMRLIIADINDGTASIDYAQYLTVGGENNFIKAINKINGMENNIVQTYVDPLDVRVRNITDYDPPFKYMDVELEKGGYDASGEYVEDDSGIRWRTPNYIYVEDMLDTAITVPEGFNMYVCLYGEGNVFKSRGTWTSGSTHNVANNYSIRWAITKAAWVAMTEEEANCVKIKQILPWYNTLATAVKEIEKIPDYYKSQLSTVIANVKTDMLAVGQNGDTFAFITDVHWNGNYKHSPNLLHYLKENTDLNLIVCGGDLIDRSTSSKSSQITDMQNCIKAFKKVGIPFLTAIGNHERNSAGVTDASLYLSENEVFAITQNPVNLMPLYYSDLDRICYYYDKVATKTRYIFIDSGQNNITPYDITAEEITWMTNVINATDSEYHIIVIVHQLGTYNLSNPISESNPFVYTQGAQDMLNALDTLLSNHSIEAVFTGHTHYDNNSTTAGGIPIIWTNSDARWQYYQMTQPSDGTVEAQCFDVVTIDYTNKKIYLRRVGRGSDREVDY